ncbi:heparan-alpha-glucosaminide N-acetyltransferase domain-containing protein [Nitrospirillum sp. BR 11164]|uniref:acyltransferase family protein n=1 Tax=Nitrospirillum sp. BR 11164 TaxID=3104324 RepID=UPI002AFF4104|nr:heparan-alpha-glucosaminide N-acetyltransferase domain-containing protein [Nitrospirillum sp. BR 11164]MEA1648926.1 heparan-alpha-glucosaminide N-acetyltransferase domain-containing protein [Nitrospirillum sp. BR 11164]
MTIADITPSGARAAIGQPANRLLSLDVLRGLAVAGMILVVSPGDWNKAYAPLKHAPWDGWTLADMVFPTFLFSVGLAIALSFAKLAQDRRAAGIKIVRRCAALIALGLVLNALPYFDLAHLRLPGILQRIALCYALAAALCLATASMGPDGRAAVNRRALLIAMAIILPGYWALLAWVPVPGVGAGHLDPGGNLASWIDRGVFTVPHLWPYGTDAAGAVVYDPEGLLSTVPATVNVLLGVLAGTMLRATAGTSKGRLSLLAAAIGLMGIGLALDPAFVINKRIWTSSFALFSGGFSLAVLVVLLALLDRGPAPVPQALTLPFRVLGGNAILAFTLSQALSAIGGVPFIAGPQGPITPQGWGDGLAGAVIADPYLASFACALGILGLVVLALSPLHRRGLHVRL